jgi:hypothetical protein
MAETTFDKVLTEALALPPEQRRLLAETLMAGTGIIQPLKSLEQLMAEQGTRPLTFAELSPAADIAPEESADEMIEWIYAQRREDSHRGVE